MPRGNLIVTLSGLGQNSQFICLLHITSGLGVSPMRPSSHRINHHIVPISLQIDNMKERPCPCSGRSQFNVFSAPYRLVRHRIHTDFYIKQNRACILVHATGARLLHCPPSRNQRCYIHIFLFLTANIPPASQMPIPFRVYLISGLEPLDK